MSLWIAAVAVVIFVFGVCVGICISVLLARRSG
jgi:hypothetical protein